MALALIPIIGALGLALEASNWWVTQRSVQNAADSAVMAASWNGGTTAACQSPQTCTSASYNVTNCSTSPGDFDCEAVGAAAKAGYATGSNNVVVYPVYLPTGPCPGTLTKCYEVTVTKQVPLYMLSVVGYAGTGNSRQRVQAVAYSGIETQNNPDCLFSTGTGAAPHDYPKQTHGDGLHTDGSPGANLAGCDIALSGDATCNGSNLGSPESFFPSGASDSGCSAKQQQAAPPTDPYASLDTNSNIPPDPCGGAAANYPQEGGSGTVNAPSGTLGGSTFSNAIYSGATYYCGDVKLAGDVSVTSDSVLVIYNGQLDLNGHKLSTSGTNGGLTVVFAGVNKIGSLIPLHTMDDNAGGGVIDISAPTSNLHSTSLNWSGVAFYQSPQAVDSTGVLSGTSNEMTDQSVSKSVNSLDFSDAGNSPTLKLSGVIYQPYANDTFKGAIDKAGNGFSCFVWVFNSMLVDGTADIYSGTNDGGVQSQCGSAGVTQIISIISLHALVG